MIGMLGGGGAPATQVVTREQAALFGGGAAGGVLSTGGAIGTSVGPAIPGFLRDFQAGQPGSVAGVIGGLVRGPVAAPAAGGARVVTRRQFILMQARAFAPGATARKIVKAARDCGIELAAATFGLSVLDVCFLIAQPPTRRRRGISAADMRRTRSTLRKVANIQDDLLHLKPTRRISRRK